MYATLIFQEYIVLAYLIVSETHQYKQHVDISHCTSAELNANSIEHWIHSATSRNDTISENVQFRNEEESLRDPRLFIDEFYRVITNIHAHTHTRIG